jgi:hypothetical protein
LTVLTCLNLCFDRHTTSSALAVDSVDLCHGWRKPGMGRGATDDIALLD